MILDFKLDLDEFYSGLNDDLLIEEIKIEVKKDVLKAVRKSDRYKEFIETKVKETLDSMENA